MVMRSRTSSGDFISSAQGVLNNGYLSGSITKSARDTSERSIDHSSRPVYNPPLVTRGILDSDFLPDSTDDFERDSSTQPVLFRSGSLITIFPDRFTGVSANIARAFGLIYSFQQFHNFMASLFM